MASRRDARRAALDILYQADAMHRDPRVVLREWVGSGRPLSEFTRELVEGTADALGEIDPVLERLAVGWTVERMASVDRSVLRLACYEMLYRPDVPVAATIDEAVDAAKELSTDDSGRFVNGVLGHLARERSQAPDGR